MENEALVNERVSTAQILWQAFCTVSASYVMGHAVCWARDVFLRMGRPKAARVAWLLAFAIAACILWETRLW